jgi:hypothetical protein
MAVPAAQRTLTRFLSVFPVNGNSEFANFSNAEIFAVELPP